MPDRPPEEQDEVEVRQEVGDLAADLLARRTSFFEGARRLQSLRHRVGGVDSDDPEFAVFAEICERSIDLPDRGQRAVWSASALQRLEPEFARIETWGAGIADAACANLVARFSGPQEIPVRAPLARRPVAAAEIDAAEAALDARFPAGYREYLAEYGEGVLGTYLRIYPPRRILGGSDNLQEWRDRIREYWFWGEEPVVLTQERALQTIIIGDTLCGDELVFHADDPDVIYVLPRDSARIHSVGGGLDRAIDWLFESAVLGEKIADRNFVPFEGSEPKR